jgi:hypothetical protein
MSNSTLTTFAQTPSRPFHPSQVLIDDPHTQVDVFTQNPQELLEAVLFKLSSASVELIPWGSVLARLLNVPRLLIVC